MNASEGEVWLFDPELKFVKGWDVSELQCLEHESNDGLRASVGGIRHGILVPVPVNLMQKAGTYYFVLHFKDNYADKYKDHQVKPALELNQKYNDLPIVYLKSDDGNWHVAWIRKPKIVSKFTKTSYEVKGAVKWVEEAGNCQIRAAVNGNFFDKRIYSGPEKPKMIGEVGIGKSGKEEWKREGKCQVKRYCFGMDEKGTLYGGTKMKWNPKRKCYEVTPSIEGKYPFGLSNVGGLIIKGDPKEDKDSNWAASPEDKVPRTAVGFSTRPCHFFLVIAHSASWKDVVNFFQNKLPDLVKQSPYGKNLNIKIQNAYMLDGGGSTQFAYLRKDKNGQVVQTDDNAYKSDGRKIANFVGVEVTCWDK